MQSMWLSRAVLKRTGQRTAGSGALRARAALLGSLAAVLALGGCGSMAPAPKSGLVSAFVSTPAWQNHSLPLDIEDDGREAQRPPLRRMFDRPDDPTQPFSPNYGEVPLPQPAEAIVDGWAPAPPA